MARNKSHPTSTAGSVLLALESRLAANAISTIMVAVGASITLVAMAYAIYGALRGPLSPPAASAATAAIFAVITLGLAVVGPQIVKAKTASAERAAARQPTAAPSLAQSGLEIGLTLALGLADAVWRRRQQRKERI